MRIDVSGGPVLAALIAAVVATSSSVAAGTLARVPRATSPCSGSGTGSFVGVGAPNGNYAGGGYSDVVDGRDNTACDGYSSIAGGYGNTVSSYGRNNAVYSTIVAGSYNSTSGLASFIGGGGGNQIIANISNSAAYTSILGGGDNTISALSSNGANYAVITGGDGNSLNGEYGFIGGGEGNSLTGTAAVIGGGYENQARGGYAVVPGGYGNSAYGEMSFAAGYKSQANFPGSFVWSDYSCCTSLTATAANQFLVRASGGITLYTNANQTCGVTLAPGASTWKAVPGCPSAKNAPALDYAARSAIEAVRAQNDSLADKITKMEAEDAALAAQLRSLSAARP